MQETEYEKMRDIEIKGERQNECMCVFERKRQREKN